MHFKLCVLAGSANERYALHVLPFWLKAVPQLKAGLVCVGKHVGDLRRPMSGGGEVSSCIMKTNPFGGVG